MSLCAPASSAGSAEKSELAACIPMSSGVSLWAISIAAAIVRPLQTSGYARLGYGQRSDCGLQIACLCQPEPGSVCRVAWVIFVVMRSDS
jgi:hypothetical protein